MKKVRCINNNGMSNLENGQIYEVELVYNDFAGEPLYRLKGVPGSKYASRFEKVIEPDFKVGDKVVFARETKGELEQWNDRFTVGKTYTVASILRNPCVNSDNGYAYFMPPECFDLAPEPKPIFQTNYSADWLKPKTKERATVKKVRCIDATYCGNQLETNKIYEVEVEGSFLTGCPCYYLKEIKGQRFHKSRFVDVIEEKYPQIVKFNTFKVIFNPPYTIVEMPIMFSDRKYTGKAKCNPEDTYDKWRGFKVAYERMMESKPCSK